MQKLLVVGALYGLVKSPRDWATHRDAQLRKMRWKNETGKEFRIHLAAEPHL